MSDLKNPTAAVLIIGNEILTGRTQDSNLSAAAKKLFSIGIKLTEARVVLDEENAIVKALNELRKSYDYVFTTGGIGPTHDDITADAVSKAFGVKTVENPKARARLEAHYNHDASQLNEARLRMARMPEGADLIDNPVSSAPGFSLENVYVLAGVPSIMDAMMDGVVAGLKRGPKIYSISVSGFVAESLIAAELREIAERYKELDIGSYPWMRQGRFGTALVIRGTDKEAAEKAADEITKLVLKHDKSPQRA